MLKNVSIFIAFLCLHSPVGMAEPQVYTQCINTLRASMVSSCMNRVAATYGPGGTTPDTGKIVSEQAKCDSLTVSDQGIQNCRVAAADADLQAIRPGPLVIDPALLSESEDDEPDLSIRTVDTVVPDSDQSGSATPKSTTAGAARTSASARSSGAKTSSRNAANNGGNTRVNNSAGASNNASDESSSRTASTRASENSVSTDGTYRGQSYESASAQAQNDLASCTTKYSYATTCCNNPSACTNGLSSSGQRDYQRLQQLLRDGPSEGGLSSYCSQLEQLSGRSGNVNAGLGGVCVTNQTSCTSTCNSLASVYRSLLASCNGCEANYVFQNTLAQLENTGSRCESLRTQSDSISRQSLSTSSSQAYSQYCSQNSNYSIPNLNAGGADDAKGDPFGCARNPQSKTCQTCSRNPSLDQCQKLIAAEEARGESGFGEAAKRSEDPQFNLPNVGDASVNSPIGGYNPGASTQVSAVPNGGGGSVPGAAAAPAKLGADGRPVAAAKGAETDIQKGFYAGGYSAQSAGSGFEGDAGGLGAKGVGRGVQSDRSGYLGMDLRQYLPGQDMDPRRLGALGAGSQIHPKEEDIWRVISIKMDEKCKLGVLWECR